MSHPIPLIILHGPLGSGKTTALRMMLKNKDLQDALIIENDVAEWNVDSETLHNHDHDVIPLSGGCVCCGSIDELKKVLCSIVESGRTKPVIIETTGVARIVRLLEWFLFHTELYKQFSLRQVIMVLDLLKPPQKFFADRNLDIQLSDMILCTKKDLVSPSQYDEWMKQLDDMKQKVSLNTNTDWTAQALQSQSTWLDRLPEEYENVDEHDMMSKVFPCKNIDAGSLRNVVQDIFALENMQIQRVKGYIQTAADNWVHIEATDNHIDITTSEPASRSAIICIGHRVDRDIIESLLNSFV